MPKYLVQIDAKNFLVNMNGATGKYGFITFRFVDAFNPESAELAAVQMIRDDAELREMVLNERDDPPTMDAIEVSELESMPDTQEMQGRIWYEMNPRRWWQFWRR